jgi:hypothetical protein
LLVGAGEVLALGEEEEEEDGGGGGSTTVEERLELTEERDAAEDADRLLLVRAIDPLL